MTHSLTRGRLAEGEREAELRERQGAGPLIVCILPAVPQLCRGCAVQL